MSSVERSYIYYFACASQNAYGAVVYMRSEYIGGKVSLSFVTSKTKVAPLYPTFRINGCNLREKVSFVYCRSIKY